MKKLITFVILMLGMGVDNAMADGITVYLNPKGFSDYGDWTNDDARFALYYFKSSNNTDNGRVDFKKIGETDFYEASVPEGYDKGIAYRMEPNTENIWNQTDDLEILDNCVIKITGWGSDKSSSELRIHGVYTITFVNGVSGWTNVNAHVWQDGGSAFTSWPGQAMTDTGETRTIKGNSYSVYSTTITSYDVKSSGELRVIFNNGSDQKDYVTFVNGKEYVYVDGVSIEEITVSNSFGWATCVTTNAVDFSEVTGLKAYTATVSGSTVTLDEAGEVPAGTALVLKATAAKSYNVPVIESASAVTNSLLGSATEALTISDSDPNNTYALVVDGSGNAQFTLMNAGTLAAGKAYLQLAKSDARELRVVFADEATGIDALVVKSETVSKEVYDLQGRRVANPTKGLYIVNGKKVIY